MAGFETVRASDMALPLGQRSYVNAITGASVQTADSEVSINLQKGQFLIFNPDHTGHQTQNLTEVPRNAFMLVVKRNEWLDSLTKNETMTFIDTKELAKESKVA